MANQVVIAIFIGKVLAGLAAGWQLRHYIHSDSWNYHRQALTEYQLLFSNPQAYFTNLFYSGYAHGFDGMLQTQNSYWNDLRDNLVIKLLSVLHVFSGGNYYVNVVLFNFIVFLGMVGLYRVFRQVYQANSVLTAMVVFLLPSVWFYGSAIHKEGLILALLGAVIFNCRQAQQLGVSIKRAGYIFFAVAALLFIRNYVLVALLPPLIAWIVCAKKNLSPTKTFTVVYLIGLILFFSISYVWPSLNPPAYMVQKQAAFFALEKGNTQIATDTLTPGIGSFVRTAPMALQHALLRPFITDTRLSAMLWPLSMELVLYQAVVIAFLFFRRKDLDFKQPFIFFSLLFGLSVCLIIGYIIPVLGAIVRYRSICLPFVMAVFILGTDWKRLATFAKIKK